MIIRIRIEYFSSRHDHLKDKIAKINAIMNHFFAALASLELLLCGKTFL